MKYKKRILFFICIVILNLIAFSTSFCDWYVTNVFPFWIATMGRLSSLVPFSVGEWMITIGVILVILWLVGNVYRLIKKSRRSRLVMKGYNLLMVDIILVVLLVLTLNWTMINRCSKIMDTSREFHISQLQALRNALVVKCNTMAGQMQRDESGKLIYNDPETIQKDAEKALRTLGETYPRLLGYYPKMKPMMYSGIMSQSSMLGYYFPFSMESNYNQKMYIVNYPQCFCHEMSHVKGYMMEDEANFIAYMACLQGDEMFQYSGFLSVLYHVDNAFFANVGAEYYLTQPQISSQVKRDNVLLTEDVKAEVEKKAVIKTETVKKASDTFNDVTIKMGGVADGMASYDRVTELLLNFYFPEEE